MTLGEFLKSLRERAELTPTEAARLIGCSRQWLYDVEGGADPKRHLASFLETYRATPEETQRAAMLMAGLAA